MPQITVSGNRIVYNVITKDFAMTQMEGWYNHVAAYTQQVATDKDIVISAQEDVTLKKQEVNTASGIALQAKNDTETIKSQVDVTKGEIDVTKQQIDQTAGEVEQAKNDAQGFTTLSQSWAEGNEPGGEGTKSSRGHAEDAAQSASDAETSKNEITEKINFTDAQEGDLFRVNAQGVAVRVNETEFLKSKVPLLKSPLAGMVDLDNLFAWDSFSRGNGPIGVSDSGQTWQTFLGDGMIITSNRASPSTDSLNASIINTGFGSLSVRGFCQTRGFNTSQQISCGFIIGKDIDNYYYILFDTATTSYGFSLYRVISGIETLLLEKNYNESGISNTARGAAQIGVNGFIKYYRRGEISPGGRSILFVGSSDYPSNNSVVDVENDNSVFVNSSDVAFAGIIGTRSQNMISNFSITRVV
ncbi:hypothetical protein [Pleomorphovibrio marinus]|uniref:hypothetical protein n=1 Tax=Pleomorphovibrio marinus TaxID=2164132 RepID=UPI00130028BC|nr:hypothetical protein [Pleomorphovibrio marinus]